MKWVKYRFTWAWGTDPSQYIYERAPSTKRTKKPIAHSWYWMTVPDEYSPQEIRSIMEEKAQREGGHSDKFRGVEWSTTRKPPASVVDAEIQRAAENLLSARVRLDDLVKFQKILGR